MSILRTIEQILGLPPMNQFDAAARPMRECFTDALDVDALRGRGHQRPAGPDESRPAAISQQQLRDDALASERMDFDRGRSGPGGRAKPHPLAGDARPG